MFPSPSLGPPWLSLSPSPALAPCGMPGTGPDALVVLVVDELDAGAEALDVLLLVVVLELLLPPPQPATASATNPAAKNPVNVLGRNLALM
jgi:hypothetical protein